MIFVTVGTQLPFDRMIRALDEWASRRSNSDIFAQIGPSTYRPKHMRWSNFLNADACREKTREASLVIAHAGMGSIITALEMGKPILVMPRRMSLGEQRNDHQLATVSQLARQGRIAAAFDEKEMIARLDDLEQFRSSIPISTQAHPDLIGALRKFVDDPAELGITEQLLQASRLVPANQPAK